MTQQINWTDIFNSMGDDLIKSFAVGEMSGEIFYQESRIDGVSPEVRKLIRNRGVVEARRLARKALRRRGVNV